MQGPVDDQVWAVGPHHLPQGILDGLLRHIRVDPPQRCPQPADQDDLPRVGPFRRFAVGGDVRAGNVGVAQFPQVMHGDELDLGFVEVGHQTFISNKTLRNT